MQSPQSQWPSPSVKISLRCWGSVAWISAPISGSMGSITKFRIPSSRCFHTLRPVWDGVRINAQSGCPMAEPTTCRKVSRPNCTCCGVKMVSPNQSLLVEIDTL